MLKTKGEENLFLTSCTTPTNVQLPSSTSPFSLPSCRPKSPETYGSFGSMTDDYTDTSYSFPDLRGSIHRTSNGIKENKDRRKLDPWWLQKKGWDSEKQRWPIWNIERDIYIFVLLYGIKFCYFGSWRFKRSFSRKKLFTVPSTPCHEIPTLFPPVFCKSFVLYFVEIVLISLTKI